MVQWVLENGNSRNRVIRFTVPKSVAENETLMYYSKEFPVHEGAIYRFQCRWLRRPGSEGFCEVL